MSGETIKGGLVVWEVFVNGEALQCIGAACWPAEDDTYQLLLSGCILDRDFRSRLKGSLPVALLVGPSSVLARHIPGTAQIQDLKEESGPGYQVLMSVKLEPVSSG